MSLLVKLPNALCEWFSDMNNFSQCVFCTQFPAESKKTPLEKPVIVFGAKSLNVLDNTVDEAGNVITDSRVAELVFSVGIHVPRIDGGSVCTELLDSMTELLLFNTGLSISEVKSDDIKYIRNTDSLYLAFTFTVDDTLKRLPLFVPPFSVE